MEKKMMMPANYNVMTEEEMTYTQGGAVTDGGAIVGLVSSVCYIGLGVAALYNYYKGMVAARAYVSAHKNEDAAAIIEGGMNTYVNYISSGLLPAIKGVAAGMSSVSLWPITAVCLLTAAN